MDEASSSGPPARGEEARAAVEAVLRDQADRAERRKRADRPPPPDRGPGLAAAAVVLAVLTVLVWLRPPALLRPPPAPQPPPRVMEAGLRMTVYVTTLRVAAYRDSVGRLPATLEEVLPDSTDREGLTYERLASDRYRLTGLNESHAVVWETGDPLSALVGDAPRVLQGPRQ